MTMATGRGLRDRGSIAGQGRSLTPGFALKLSSNMTVTLVRIDGCTDHMNKKPDLIIEKHKI